MKQLLLIFCWIPFCVSCGAPKSGTNGPLQRMPNIVLIYTDDLGYGDISANGATKIKTPAIDKIATEGLRFTQAYATAATCTPSRFSLLTGKYAWRQTGTGIAPGDAALIIPTTIMTLPKMLQYVGYQTAVVGKWHLGLGLPGQLNWNTEIKPGPLDIGFDYAFIMPATGDRVPCVYVENRRIVDLDPADPVFVDYTKKIGSDPTGAEQPQLLKMKPSHGHDNTIVNGVSRIGWMTGGTKARWVDEDMADVFTSKALQFIEKNKSGPFFLYFATHDIHVPRVPHSRFLGKSGMGPRGDAILQLDWTVSQVTKKLKDLNIDQNTLLIFTSDNGPVVDDGYQDDAVARLNGHTPWGIFRGGKYSAFEAGTRVPFLVRWPQQVKPNATSHAPFSQVDLLASFAKLTGQKVPQGNAPDSYDYLTTLLGKETKGRDYIVQQALSNTLTIIAGGWKYIEPGSGPKLNRFTNIELGNDPAPQLYNIAKDPGERQNLAASHPEKVRELSTRLNAVRKAETR